MSGAPPRRALIAALAFALAVSCTETAPPRADPARDVQGGAKLARDSAAILLQYSAYDYGLAGALAGERMRTVAASRYATVMRGAAKTVSAFNSSVLTATLDRSGPIRDRLVPLADTLTDLARDGETYADGGDPAAFARVITDVSAAWLRLRDLATTLPQDDALQATIARGLSFKVTATAATQSTLVIGPYSSAREAQQALHAMGAPLNGSVTQSSPFIIRIGPYAERAAADEAAAGLGKRGITSVITESRSFTFARSGPLPDAELWREPSRVQEIRGGSRTIALGPDGSWLLTGSDDGYAALFDPSGVLTALPHSFAGLSILHFSDDGRFFASGGQHVTFLTVPAGHLVGSPMRFTGAATQVLFVPGTRAFVVASPGPTGEPGGGPGLIGGRAPDGAPLGAPFPIVTPAAGAQIATSETGDLYVATTSGGAYDIEVFRPGRDAEPRAVARIAGVGRALAVDRGAEFAAAITDDGTFRFALADPKTLTRLGPPVRDVVFGADGTLYLLDQTSLRAIDAEGAVKWTAPLVDGRRIVAARRPVVLDGTEKLLVFGLMDGAAEELGAGGAVNDLAISADGRVVGAVVDARRAVLFTLP